MEGYILQWMDKAYMKMMKMKVTYQKTISLWIPDNFHIIKIDVAGYGVYYFFIP